jgi:anti-sigma B factor antagonist
MPQSDPPAPRDERAASNPPVFDVRPEQTDGVYRLTVSGELDLATRGTLNDALKLAEASEAQRILLDLTDLTFIDSAGIEVLAQAHRRSETDAGTQLRMVPVGGQVREMLKLTGLMGVLDFTE